MGMKLGIYSLLLLIGGVLAALAFFLSWASGVSVNGLDYLKLIDVSIRAIAPLLVLIIGVVVILLILLNVMGTMKSNQTTKIIVLVLGLLAIVFSLWFSDFSFKYVGIGFWLAIVAGILLIITPLLSILNVLPDDE